MTVLAGYQTLTDSHSASQDFPEGVVFDDGWRSPNHDDANTRTVLDGPTLSKPTTVATLPPSYGGVTGANSRAFLARESTLRAFDATGESLWAADAADTHPPSVLDGTVYAPHPEKPLLRGFDAKNGDVTEIYDLPARAVTPPAWSNGRESFAVALADGRIAGVDRSDGETWTGDPWGDVVVPFAHNMTLVVAATTAGEVYAYGEQGTPRWRSNLDAVGLVAPITGDERVYAGGWDGTIAALSRPDDPAVSPRERGVVDAPLAFDGRHLYHGGGDLAALDPTTGETVWSYSQPLHSAPAVVGESLLVAGLTDETRRAMFLVQSSSG